MAAVLHNTGVTEPASVSGSCGKHGEEQQRRRNSLDQQLNRQRTFIILEEENEAPAADVRAGAQVRGRSQDNLRKSSGQGRPEDASPLPSSHSWNTGYREQTGASKHASHVDTHTPGWWWVRGGVWGGLQ